MSEESIRTRSKWFSEMCLRYMFENLKIVNSNLVDRDQFKHRIYIWCRDELNKETQIESNRKFKTHGKMCKYCKKFIPSGKIEQHMNKCIKKIDR